MHELIKSQLSFNKILLYHFYPGVALLLFYIFMSPFLIEAGYPGLTALLLAELFILSPIGITHLYRVGHGLNHSYSIKGVISYTDRISKKTFTKWTIIGVLGVILIYVPLFPVGIWARESLFSWLPEWYFNPAYGNYEPDLLPKLFLVGIVTDGIVAPIVEELYFRGYLLPRMEHLKKWAPIVNGALFGVYHLWQPHNYLAAIGIGIILSYIVWKKRNVYLGIAIHCTLNISGAIAGYMAASSGVLVDR